MGWWARQWQRLNDWNWDCHTEARRAINEIQNTVRDDGVVSLEIACPLEAEMLKCRIQEMAVEGYPHSLRTSIVLWEQCKEQYAEWITDNDRPTSYEREGRRKHRTLS